MLAPPMSRPAALTILPIQDPTWRAEYQGAIAGARSFADRLPLVRVVVPEPSNEERAQREQTQIEDVLRKGLLRPAHESKNTHAMAKRLEVDPSLYFHAGRTHPQYGKLALVFRRLPQDDAVDATPFGLGGLLCNKAWPGHVQGECTSPVAHDAEAAQIEFVSDSRWTSAWRDQAAHFLAAYFGDGLERYFLPGAAGKPNRPDPAGIYTDAWSRDWRSWTIEVRITQEVDLFQVLASGDLEAWAIDGQLETWLEQNVRATGAVYPWWEALLKVAKDRRIEAPGLGVEAAFAEIDREVKDRCLR